MKPLLEILKDRIEKQSTTQTAPQKRLPGYGFENSELKKTVDAVAAIPTNTKLIFGVFVVGVFILIILAAGFSIKPI